MASILIIDDVPAVLLSLRIVLRGGGHQIAVAETGARGLALLEAGDFDLVITDIWMPGTGGVDVIRAGRKLSPRTRFLAVTGGDPNGGDPNGGDGAAPDDAGDASRHRHYGADAVLLKPFEKDELLGAVAVLLEPVASPVAEAGMPA